MVAKQDHLIFLIEMFRHRQWVGSQLEVLVSWRDVVDVRRGSIGAAVEIDTDDTDPRAEDIDTDPHRALAEGAEKND